MNNAFSNVADSNAFVPPLSDFAFIAASGTATLAGFYVNEAGTQIGNRVSYSITTATAFVSLASGGKFPVDQNGETAVGFLGNLSGSGLYMNLTANPGGTMGQAPTSSDVPINTGPVAFGRVNDSLIALLESDGGSVTSVFETNHGFNKVTYTETAVSVGLTSSQVLAANANRKTATFTNDSSNTVYLSSISAAVLNRGWALYPNGSISFVDDVPTTAFTAISTGAASNLCVNEGV